MDRPCELLDLLLCVIVGWVFRLRENNPFNTHQGEFSWLPMDPADLMPRNGYHATGGADGGARSANRGAAGSCYETIRHGAGVDDVIRRYDNSDCCHSLGRKSVVVVENPRVREKELVESVSIARPTHHSERAPEVASAPEGSRLGFCGAVAGGRGDATAWNSRADDETTEIIIYARRRATSCDVVIYAASIRYLEGTRIVHRCFTKHTSRFPSRASSSLLNAPASVHQCFSTANTSNIRTVRHRIETMAKRQFGSSCTP